MITEATRKCRTCGELYQLGDAECTKCGRSFCTPPEEWPDGAKRLLFLLVIVDSLATKLNEPEEEQLFWLLENKMRGRWFDGRLVTHAASAAECYPEFLRLFEKWRAAGSPTDFTAVAQLRGAFRH